MNSVSTILFRIWFGNYDYELNSDYLIPTRIWSGNQNHDFRKNTIRIKKFWFRNSDRIWVSLSTNYMLRFLLFVLPTFCDRVVAADSEWVSLFFFTSFSFWPASTFPPVLLLFFLACVITKWGWHFFVAYFNLVFYIVLKHVHRLQLLMSRTKEHIVSKDGRDDRSERVMRGNGGGTRAFRNTLCAYNY